MDKFFFLMAVSFAAPISVLSSCIPHQDEIFRNSSGEILICQRYAQQSCGLHLMQCGEHSDLEFECLSNVHYLGRPGHLTREALETPVTAINVWESPVPPKDSCLPCIQIPEKAKKKK